MGIKLLDKSVVNKISAGEVVEKPASIVKELIENSIDAGAKNITIEIIDGGIKKITVIDDGCGIKADEIKLAFMPHATSKLVEIEDLETLNTMGFRGEALSTISAISRVTIITKTADEDSAIMVKLEGGEETYRSEVAGVTGTKIEVNDVFYNTPARLKFLRKPKSEESDITNYVEKMILSHNTISFKYIVNDKIVYNTSNSSLIDNIYTIYGKDVADGVLEVSYNIGDYSISGYISKPECTKANRTYQNLFVNGRYCNNPLVSTAVQNAYDNFMMKGKFPLYVLFIKLPQNELDVNVHPNKLEVKFENTRKIYQLCNDATYKALYDFNHIRNVDMNNTVENNNVESFAYENSIHQFINTGNINDEGVSFSSDNNKNEQNTDKETYSSILNKNNNNSGSFNFQLTNNLLEEINLSETKYSNNNVTDTTPLPKNVEQQDYKKLFDAEYRIVGKIFNTYLILEQNDRVYMIDQHAAHERQKYDALIKNIENNNLNKQDLLIPYVFTVNNNEYDFISSNLELLNSFGIEICEFGNNTFRVTSVPLVLAEINIKDFFDNVLSNTNGFVKTPIENIREKFMQMACKSAIKGGDDIKDSEIKYLLNKLKEETKVLLCPHGRPIIIEIDKKQIEKWFKRIVDWKR